MEQMSLPLNPPKHKPDSAIEKVYRTVICNPGLRTTPLGKIINRDHGIGFGSYTKRLRELQAENRIKGVATKENDEKIWIPSGYSPC